MPRPLSLSFHDSHQPGNYFPQGNRDSSLISTAAPHVASQVVIFKRLGKRIRTAVEIGEESRNERSGQAMRSLRLLLLSRPAGG